MNRSMIHGCSKVNCQVLEKCAWREVRDFTLTVGRCLVDRASLKATVWLTCVAWWRVCVCVYVLGLIFVNKLCVVYKEVDALTQS